MGRGAILRIDALVNLGLGGLLVGFPAPLVRALGVPPAPSAFYPSVLGGVLIGIAAALWLEASNRRRGARGLGLLGAMVINLSGGLVLAGWLVFGKLPILPRGAFFLWALVVVLVGLSLVELLTGTRGNAGP